jgi:hypothetical protein
VTGQRIARWSAILGLFQNIWFSNNAASGIKAQVVSRCDYFLLHPGTPVIAGLKSIPTAPVTSSCR